MSPAKKKKTKKQSSQTSKKQTVKKEEQKPELSRSQRRRVSVWTSMLVPFALILFLFGGTDALFLRDPWALTTALFIIVAINWGVFFPLKSRLFEWGISAVLILSWFGVILFVIPPIRYSRETTYVSEPRKANGEEIDYFPVIEERVHPSGTWDAPEQNGFRDFLDAVGPKTLDTFQWNNNTEKDAYWKLLCKKLKVDISKQSDVPFQSAESFFAQKSQSLEPALNERKFIEIESGEMKLVEEKISGFQLVERLSNQPWIDADSPTAKEWLNQNENALDLLAKSVRKEKFLCPLLRLDENQSFDTIPKWGRYFVFFNRSFPIRVQYELGRGNPEKAWEDVLTQFFVAQHLFEQVCDVEDYFNAETIWNDAVRCAVAVARYVAQHSNSEKIAQKIESPEKFLEQKLGEIEPFFEPFSEKTGSNLLLGERFNVLEHVLAAAFGRNLREEMLNRANQFQDQNFDPEIDTEKLQAILEKNAQKNEPPPEILSSAFSKRALRMYPWNETLTKINRYFDEAELLKSPQEAFAKTLFLRDTGSPWSHVMRIGFLKAIPDKVGQQEVMIWIDKSRSLERQLLISRSKSALMRCIFYLEMYKIEHSAYPNSLAQLEGQYGDKIPLDPCSFNRSLKYSLSESGQYLLYSVGPNRIDDGGATRKQKKDADDISFPEPVANFVPK